VQALLARGLRPVLGGRNPTTLEALAGPLGLEARPAPLDAPDQMATALRGVEVVLHAAGPFSQTAEPMVEACLRAGVHYLDITGEIGVFEALARRHADARRRGIMLMPGVGFDVVPSDCLAAHVTARLPGATHLALGIAGLRFYSRGSARTMLGQAARGMQVRRAGAIVTVSSGMLWRRFDYGHGPEPSDLVSMGDVSSAYFTTGIPNVEVYLARTPALRAALLASRYWGWMLATAPWQTVLDAGIDLLPVGPTGAERESVQTVVVAEATDDAGGVARARLRAPEAYAFTAASAAAIAAHALAGDIEPGFQTPGRVYGPDFVLSLDGVVREDLPGSAAW
jgi:short subunit dehydrogenase-like uncharacterized protein